jgi:small subunit ribosomal protein S6
MRNYELTYIIKPDLDPASVTALIERINGFVKAEGGTVTKTNQWGMRHLAYPIRRFRDGNYIFSVVELESISLARVEQRLRMVEDLLRYLLVRADDGAAAEGDVMGGAEVAVEAAVPVQDAVVEIPVVEASVVEMPVVEMPMVEAPVVEAPVVEAPAEAVAVAPAA